MYLEVCVVLVVWCGLVVDKGSPFYFFCIMRLRSDVTLDRSSAASDVFKRLALYAILCFIFTYFYTSISINITYMADNMALMLLGIKDYDIEGIEDVFVGFLNDNKKNLRFNLYDAYRVLNNMNDP